MTQISIKYLETETNRPVSFSQPLYGAVAGRKAMPFALGDLELKVIQGNRCLVEMKG
jgi:hypothetical protein